MASIPRLLLLAALPSAACAFDASAAAAAPAAYLQEDRGICGDGSPCYSSLLQHSAAGLQARRDGAETSDPDRATQRPDIGREDLKVYVYDLPAKVRINGTKVKLRDLKCPQEESGGIDPSEDCVFGKVLNISLPSRSGGVANLQMRDVFNFALGRIFWVSLLQHPRRTKDPRQADLFFIPAFNTNVHPNETHCPTAEQLVGWLPHLSSETAERHFWLTPSTAWRTRTCEVFNSQPNSPSPAARLIARTTKLALEDRLSAPGLLQRDAEAGTIHQVGRSPPIAHNLHSIPYAAVISALDDESVQAWMEHTAARDREFLVGAAWGLHGLGSTIELRTQLRRQCEQSSACLFEDLGEWVGGESHTEVVHKLKLRSTFCLEPTGDTPSRKGMVDSIVAGCIPVLFNPLQARLWPWHVGGWEDASVLLTDPSEDVVGLLAQIPKAEVARLRANMARLVPGLTFHRPGAPRPGDALETALAGAWAAASG